MLQTHYRSSLDFRFELLDGATNNAERLASCIKNLRWAAENSPMGSELTEADRALSASIQEAQAEFARQMDDDFNSSGALAALFGLVTSANTYLAQVAGAAAAAVTLRAADTLQELCAVLGLELSAANEEDELPAGLVELAREQAGFEGGSASAAAEALLAARQVARTEKNWAVADAIRDGIAALGLMVEDTAAGARLRSKRA